MALRETGEALSAIAEVQHSYDAEVNQNFLEPLRQLLDKDIKEVMVWLAPAASPPSW